MARVAAELASPRSAGPGGGRPPDGGSFEAEAAKALRIMAGASVPDVPWLLQAAAELEGPTVDPSADRRRCLISLAGRLSSLLLGRPVGTLRGVGARRAAALSRLGVSTVGDLLRLAPRRYEDRRRVAALDALEPGRPQLVRAWVKKVSQVRLPGGRVLTRACLGDGRAEAEAVWFNQPYLARRLEPGTALLLWGRVDIPPGRGSKPRLLNPEFEPDPSPLSQAPGGDGPLPSLHSGRIVPVYPLAGGLGARWLRGLVHQALETLPRLEPGSERAGQPARRGEGAVGGPRPARRPRPAPLVADPLPRSLRRSLRLPHRGWALEQAHFPASFPALEMARRRLKFEELFLLQVALGLARARRRGRPAPAFGPPGQVTARLLEGLPFKPTGAQVRAMAQVGADLESAVPMCRLLQGEVGSGKTLVAAYALARAVDSHWQGAMMAPTELLARQHAQALAGLLRPAAVTVELLTGADPRDAATVREGCRQGSVAVVVGTQALIQEGVEFRRLGLVVVDEQHRFGVRQRLALSEKGMGQGQGGGWGGSGGPGEPEAARGGPAGLRPHLLVLSATPIPRSLALAFYGDLDLTVLNQLPPGRRPVITRRFSPAQREEAYALLRAELAQGHQAYVVCPRIGEAGEGGAAGGGGPSRPGVAAVARRLATRLAPYRVEALHGRMDPEQRACVMEAFRRGEIAVLVATSIVEVGVDVPGATVVLVEGAEHFGLAQLHQIRGRVGRSSLQAYCLLVGEPAGSRAQGRLEAMVRSRDGMLLALEDLRLRGPGDPFGARQHGALGLALADPLADPDLVRLAHQQAWGLLRSDPGLDAIEHRLLRAEVLGRLGPRLGLEGAG
ncbi:MAG: ATP-dependent DNA helicase RecG [Acetobacteraceae bacterium]|nr:ATP-dependent DNA helicase RecG [Acetobacteraceae bacterium]